MFSILLTEFQGYALLYALKEFNVLWAYETSSKLMSFKGKKKTTKEKGIQK